MTSENKTKTEIEKGDLSSLDEGAEYKVTWGPAVFRLVVLLSAIFVWWLVIYDHGVVSSH